MGTEVKICGLSSVETLRAALDNGADYVGFVFYPSSPRNVSLGNAKVLSGMARGRARSVALMVDPTDALVLDVVGEVRPDLIQLHGSETVARCREIGALTGCGIIKAVKVAVRADVEAGLAYADCVDLILFDAKAPASMAGALPGGNGLCFDWRILDGVSRNHRFMLSGGLEASNVAEAIRLTEAQAVDVSSGVERAPGIKDTARIAAFLAAAKGS